MVSVLRAIGGIVAGIVLALVLLVAVELFSAIVHPMPEGFTGTQEEMCAHVERYPAWVLAVVVPLWSIAALASTWIAGKLGGLASALAIGVLLLAGLGVNIAKLPYPAWFRVACLVAVPAATATGIYWTKRPTTTLIVEEPQ